MEREEYERMYALETTHWWFAGKRRIAASMLSKAGRHTFPRILDVGCGTGANLNFLSHYGQSYGIDISPIALEFCRARGLRTVSLASIEELPFADNSYDLVTAFDVLYHRQVFDDQTALNECFRVLRPGGHLLLTDSALQWLRSKHDEVVHARQRYSAAEMRQKVRRAGFGIRKLSYANTLLFPAVAAVRLLERRKPADDKASDLKPMPGPLNAALKAVYGFEAMLLAKSDLPIGSSLVCLAQKPASTHHV